MLPGATTVHEFVSLLSAAELDLLRTYRPLSGKTFVITGALAHDVRRASFTALLEEWGARTMNEVQPSTDVLLAVDPGRMTVKRKEAGRFGVTILNEHRFVTEVLFDALLVAEDDKARAADYTIPPVPEPEWYAGDAPMKPEFEDDIAPLPSLVSSGTETVNP